MRADVHERMLGKSKEVIRAAHGFPPHTWLFLNEDVRFLVVRKPRSRVIYATAGSNASAVRGVSYVTSSCRMRSLGNARPASPLNISATYAALAR
jgi:hypothetical protein